jgi:hypothetical protein
MAEPIVIAAYRVGRFRFAAFFAFFFAARFVPVVFVAMSESS